MTRRVAAVLLLAVVYSVGAWFGRHGPNEPRATSSRSVSTPTRSQRVAQTGDYEGAPAAVHIGTALNVADVMDRQIQSVTTTETIPPEPVVPAGLDEPAPMDTKPSCPPSMGTCIVLPENPDGSIDLPDWIAHWNDGEAP